MKRVLIYPVKERIYQEVMQFVKQHAPKRYQYANKFYKQEDRYNSAVAYVLLTMAYNQNMIEFEIGKNGKPYYVEKDRYLSISHTKNVVAIAISDSDIAIDCELEQSIDDTVINETFSKKEKFLVDNKILKKNWIWNAKEAISKLYNEDWYSYPRTEIVYIDGQVFDEKNRNISLEFKEINDASICVASQGSENTEFNIVSEAVLIKWLK